MQTAATAIASVLRFGGFMKFGTKPSGGSIAGPFMIISCTAGGKLGKFLRSTILTQAGTEFRSREWRKNGEREPEKKSNEARRITT